MHTVVGTAGNEADVRQTEHLLYGEDKDVFLDAGYVGGDQREALKDRNINWQIVMKRGKLKVVSNESSFERLFRKRESLKASIRFKVKSSTLFTS